MCVCVFMCECLYMYMCVSVCVYVCGEGYMYMVTDQYNSKQMDYTTREVVVCGVFCGVVWCDAVRYVWYLEMTW